MKPPYDITSEILSLVGSISEKIGQVRASFITESSPQLRKRNQIRTIHSSLQIEGNTLTQEQVTALLENKRVVGPTKDILEVQNAITVYNRIDSFVPSSTRSFLDAHRMLMEGLIEDAGRFRRRSVGIARGSELSHVAPPAENIPHLMQDLFDYVEKSDELVLIKSCVFHYELEFIHPFLDGNGRMGRLWQTVILNSAYPFFRYVPFETLVSECQAEYYEALASCDKAGNSTRFIAFMLKVIDASLAELVRNGTGVVMSQESRLIHFCSLNFSNFTRRDYMQVFNSISSATASRDLKAGIEGGFFQKKGEKNQTIYEIIKKQ